MFLIRKFIDERSYAKFEIFAFIFLQINLIAKLISLSVMCKYKVITSRNHLITVTFSVHTYIYHILQNQCRCIDIRIWTITTIPISTRKSISRAARDCICFCTCRLLPIDVNARKTEKESHACMPFLVRINAIERKFRSSHVHAPATHLESRDHLFCQLTIARYLLGICASSVHSKAAIKLVSFDFRLCDIFTMSVKFVMVLY